MTVHKGACHCRAVTFEFDAPAEGLIAWDCDCESSLHPIHMHTHNGNEVTLSAVPTHSQHHAASPYRQHLCHEAQHTCVYT